MPCSLPSLRVRRDARATEALRHRAAVHGKQLSGDVRRGRHAEEADGARRVRRLTQSPERRPRAHRLQLRRLLLDGRLEHRRARHPRGDAVDADPVGRPLARQRLGHVHHGLVRVRVGVGVRVRVGVGVRVRVRVRVRVTALVIA